MNIWLSEESGQEIGIKQAENIYLDMLKVNFKGWNCESTKYHYQPNTVKPATATQPNTTATTSLKISILYFNLTIWKSERLLGVVINEWIIKAIYFHNVQKHSDFELSTADQTVATIE